MSYPDTKIIILSHIMLSRSQFVSMVLWEDRLEIIFAFTWLVFDWIFHFLTENQHTRTGTNLVCTVKWPSGYVAQFTSGIRCTTNVVSSLNNGRRMAEWPNGRMVGWLGGGWYCNCHTISLLNWLTPISRKIFSHILNAFPLNYFRCNYMFLFAFRSTCSHCPWVHG